MKFEQVKQQQASNWLTCLIMDSCKSMCLKLNNEELSTKTSFNMVINDNDDDDKASHSTGANEEEKCDHQDRPHDVVIFAASSSVGQFLVEEIALVVDKYYSSNQVQVQTQPTSISNSTSKQLRDPIQYAQTEQRRKSVPRRANNLSWAVAGRSASKLSDTLCRAELSTGIKDLSLNVPVILADLNHHKSLMDMCSKARLVINCAGPYSLGGAVLIETCIGTRTDYIDISHETTFIEQTRRLHSTAAKQAGVYIINGCGFQSMAAEIGLNFIKQVVDGHVSEVKIILNLSDAPRARAPGNNDYGHGIVTKGMWRSLIVEKEQQILVDERIKSGGSLNGQQRPFKLNREAPPNKFSFDFDDSGKPLIKRQDTQSLVKNVVEFRNNNSIAWLQLFTGMNSFGTGYCLPINTLISDQSSLIQSELTNYEHGKSDSNDGCWQPIRSTSFISLKYLTDTIILLIWMFLFNFFVKISPLRKILKLFPFWSSLGQVHNKTTLDRDSLSHIKFCQTFLAYGIPRDDSVDPLKSREEYSMRKKQQLLIARVVGPEPNHVATATFAVQAAVAVLIERAHLPTENGVFTPGAAFIETNIVHQLRKRNIKFEILKRA